MASISEDALRSVPSALREASFGIGARKSTTVVKVVVPGRGLGHHRRADHLGLASDRRDDGRCARVRCARSGAAHGAPHAIPGLTMTAAMAQLATGSDQVVGSGLAFQSLFFVGAVLFLMTLALNVLANRDRPPLPEQVLDGRDVTARIASARRPRCAPALTERQARRPRHGRSRSRSSLCLLLALLTLTVLMWDVVASGDPGLRQARHRLPHATSSARTPTRSVSARVCGGR